VPSTTLSNAFLYDIKQHDPAKQVKAFVVYRFNSADPVINKDNAANIYRIVPSTAQSATLTIPDFDLKNKIIAITSIDINNNESELTIVK
jgi:hypothetical protein